MTVHAEADATFAGVRTSVGAEAGFFGAEGRGLYAGIGGYGLHAQVSHLEDGFDGIQGSWGFEERAYIGYGNNTVDDKGQKKGSIVSMELWLPDQGKHLTFGDKYDVSNAGLQNALLNAIEENFGKKFRNAYENEKDLAKKAVMLNDAMLAAGFVETEHLNLLHGEGVKTTYAIMVTIGGLI